ncbi:MAG: GGDEF domain-containing protein [Rhodobacteraceae bacterium]|nr:GGDEF domain-containing protein [Paracoccaceae bacterium]
MNDLEDFTAVLDALCPLHLMVDELGAIHHVGPTLCKILKTEGMVPGNFWGVLKVQRPRSVVGMPGLIAQTGKRLHLALGCANPIEMKGVLVPLSAGQFIVNLSLSMSVVDAVQRYALTSTDFPPTDLTIDMLYMIEAKTAALQASSKLNHRLAGAKVAAEEKAQTDTLTGLKNRRAMDLALDRLHSWNSPYTVMSLDLDFFKAVNDTLGHAAGDHVLQTMAKVLLEETRDDDIAVRLGGDEFTLILPHMTDPKTVDGVASRIIARLSAPIPFHGQMCHVAVSAGSAAFDPKRPLSREAVQEQADAALYASKRAGRARHTAFSGDLHEAPLAASTETATR